MLSSNVNEVIGAVLNSLFFLRKDFTHTYWRNVGCEDCKQSPRVLRFVSMCVLTIGECEDSGGKLRSLHLIKHKNAHKRTKIKKTAFYALKKHLSGKKSFICLFVFLCFLCFVLLLVESLCFLCFLLGCVFVFLVLLVLLVLSVLLVHQNLFIKKKEFKTALITSFTLLLC